MTKKEAYVPSEEQLKQLNSLLSIVSLSEKQNIAVWVFGGYGLDALYGELTRDHRDFDLYIPEKSKDEFIKIIESLGYKSTGEKVGTVGKSVYKNSALSPGFQLEFATIEQGLKLMPRNDISLFLPKNPLGRLDGNSIWTPTLVGFKKIIEINNNLAKSDTWSEYPHLKWQSWILRAIEEKSINKRQ